MGPVTEVDPIEARRAQLGRFAARGKRVGYLAIAVALVGFLAVGLTDYAAWAVWMTAIALVAACVVLPIPIVLAYGVRAAARDEAAARARRQAEGTRPEGA